MKVLAVLIAFSPTLALADAPVIEAVEARMSGTTWNFSVTIRHPDSGWDHYADGWEVIAPDGSQLGFRELLHPHETEQPFTRSLGGVEIPGDLTQVSIRAKCSVDGWTSDAYVVELTN